MTDGDRSMDISYSDGRIYFRYDDDPERKIHEVILPPPLKVEIVRDVLGDYLDEVEGT